MSRLGDAVIIADDVPWTQDVCVVVSLISNTDEEERSCLVVVSCQPVCNHAMDNAGIIAPTVSAV